jgi:hypothetical protein
MNFSKNKIRFILGGALAVFAMGAQAAPVPHSKPNTLIKHIASYGAYAVVNYSKDVTNDFGIGGCSPTGEYALVNPDKIRTFLIDYSTADGKSNYVLIMAAAAAKKKTTLKVSGCDVDFGTGLPVVTSVETIF